MAKLRCAVVGCEVISQYHRLQSEFVEAFTTHQPILQPAASNLEVWESTFFAYEAIETGQVIQLG